VTAFGLELAALAPREQGWFWWAALVLCVVLLLLLLAVVRRRLLLPMRHRPSDTTDAWQEAGRRFRVPEDEKGAASDADEESP